MRLLTVFSLLLLLVLPTTAQDSEVLDPQKGAGPVTFEMLEEQLQGLGPVEERSYFHHGKAWGATVIWPDDPLRRVTAVLSDPPDDHPAYIVVNGLGSRYVLPDGIRPGSNLADLEKANGRPFVLRGLAQDDAGEVLNWCGGKLEKELAGVTLFLYAGKDISETLTSDAEFDEACGSWQMSDSPVLRKLQLEVGKIQMARPVESLPSGPSYGFLQTVPAESAPPELLSEPEELSGLLYSLPDGSHALLLEATPEDGATDRRTVLSFLEKAADGTFLTQAQTELDFSWQPKELTVAANDAGHLDQGLILADQGSFMTVASWAPLERPATTHFLSLIRGSEETVGGYRLVRSDEGTLQARQFWNLPKLEPYLGPVDYVWDGQAFCFPDGSKQ